MEELEGKLIDIDAEVFMNKLNTLKIGTFEVLQKDKIFVYGASIFRIRDQDGRYFFTYKGPVKRLGGLKSREEIELEISDPWKMQKILLILGINVSSPLIKEKRVKKFEINKAKCDLVFRAGIKPYLEIEGNLKDIKDACNILMIDFNSLVPFHPKDKI